MAKAAIIGSGPNGLGAAITLARAGVEVAVFEARETIGGAASTGEITLPGFHHDLGSSVYPMGISSPFFRTLPLEDFGLKWIQPDAPVAHPLDDGSAVVLEHSVDATAAGLGKDGRAYARLMRPLVEHWDALCEAVLSPLLQIPAHPILMARFGMFGAMPATMMARALFKGERARALFAGNAAHSVLPLDSPFSAAVGLVLAASGHGRGWPVAAGGGQSIANALGAYLRSLGGVMYTGRRVTSLDELEGYDLVLCDVSPRQLVQLAGSKLPASYTRSLEGFRYGPAAFKIDWALSEPIPWTAPECLRAATVHVGGSLEEFAISERAPWEGGVAEKPFVLVTQPSLFDPLRAPLGKHTAWGYCHVPNGYAGSAEAKIEAQMERFAPGFRDCILAKKVWTPAQFERWDVNLVGGDLSSGAMNLSQLIARPTLSAYRTPVKGLYLCSASTPPGGAVHGMCGFHAATAALKDLRSQGSAREADPSLRSG